MLLPENLSSGQGSLRVPGMALSGVTHGRTTDDFQDMLLNMDFDASALGRQPKRACHGQLAEVAQSVVGACVLI